MVNEYSGPEKFRLIEIFHSYFWRINPTKNREKKFLTENSSIGTYLSFWYFLRNRMVISFGEIKNHMISWTQFFHRSVWSGIRNELKEKSGKFFDDKMKAENLSDQNFGIENAKY